MTLSVDEFIRRFLLHVLPKGFHRIRYYGFFANSARREKINQERCLLTEEPVQSVQLHSGCDEDRFAPFICRQCACPMTVIRVLAREQLARAPPIRAKVV